MIDDKDTIPETIDTAGEAEEALPDGERTPGDAPGQDSTGGVPDDASGSSGAEGQARG